MSPIAYMIPQACEVSGLGRSSLYKLLKSGELRAVKHGKKTLILDKDLRSWLNARPQMQSGANSPKHRKNGEALSAA